MRKSLRYSLRFLVIVAVLAALSPLLSPPVTTRSPYLSAISDWTVGQALASATCPDRGCSSDLTKCEHVKGLSCRRIDRCSESVCP